MLWVSQRDINKLTLKHLVSNGVVQVKVRGDTVGGGRRDASGNGRWWSVGECLCGWWAVFVVVIIMNGGW